VFYFEIRVSILSSVGERDEVKHRRILGLAEGSPVTGSDCGRPAGEPFAAAKASQPARFELREAVNGQEAVALFEHGIHT
jgi:hypothetical protein